MQRNIYSVCQVNSYIKNMFAQDYMLGLVYVRGETSNVKYHSSGHIYFTLKDEKSSIACVCFSGYRKGLDFRLEEGMQVVAGGSIEVYERDGKYQLYVKEIRREGKGDLAERFEALKLKLEEMGMFDAQYKQPIPKYVRTLGVVTASTGAAIRDIINVATRRNPYIQIILYPAIVQGDAAADSIVRGIQSLEAYGVDVMIVGRGGGSMEDLFCFNDEKVAQAIFDCMVPVISAVGHETDFAIADFVADLRAPTPSAAAELAVFDYRDFEESLEIKRQRMQKLLREQMRRRQMRLEHLERRLKLQSPEKKINEKRMQADAIEERLNALVKEKIMKTRHRMQLLGVRLEGNSPLAKLNRGYAHIADKSGKTIKSATDIKTGDYVEITLKDGVAEAVVASIQRGDIYGEKAGS
ncbi:MAG: exodeoxyribonuclease VII large subunit [Lachnospiraceae bacterium]|nr:exodeoxyribonuclease VII large subunit [Lachnospiraceae bacterium]